MWVVSRVSRWRVCANCHLPLRATNACWIDDWPQADSELRGKPGSKARKRGENPVGIRWFSRRQVPPRKRPPCLKWTHGRRQPTASARFGSRLIQSIVKLWATSESSGSRSRRRAGFSATRLWPPRSKRLAASKLDSTATRTREFADNPSRRLRLGLRGRPMQQSSV
jgi:hypothetical protein